MPDSSDQPTTPEEVATANPLADALTFNLSLPTIEVRMVNASALEEYEIWFGASSVVAAGTVGFLVAYLQSFQTVNRVHQSQPAYLVVTVLFFVLFLLAALRAWIVRRRLRLESRTYSMKAVGGPGIQSS
jgi:hypothetical protein